MDGRLNFDVKARLFFANGGNKLQLIDIFKTRTRHPMRPRSSDIIKHLFSDFRDYQAQGDSLIMGEGHFKNRRIYVVAQQKPTPDRFRSAKDVAKLNWGMLTAEEHSQVLKFIRHLTETGPHENSMLLSMIDTYGADISMESAQKLQAFFIAHLIRAYLKVPIRTISLVIGEGGSGGALAMQVADRRAAMEDALYATAPAESVAAIIFRDPARLEDALAISKCTSKDLMHFNVVNNVIPMTKKINDSAKAAENVGIFLDKTMKDLFKRNLDRLIAQRSKSADELGIIQVGRIDELRKYLERPLSYFHKAPPDLQVMEAPSPSGGVHVDDNYGDGSMLQSGQQYIRCGQERERSKGGCGAMIELDEYLKAHQVCPNCGKRHVLDAAGWINALCDPGSFHELFRNVTVHDLLPEEDIHAYYRDFLKKQEKRTSFNESLVTAHATMHGYPAVLAISEFRFAGGSMGVVFGEKFRQAVEYSLRKRWPLVSVCCSGGARLYEGIVALMQMTKTISALERLKEAGIPFISILADPATGGAIASYAALGDICLAEPGALVIFTGPRVMEARGFPVEEELVRSDSLKLVSDQTIIDPVFYGDIRGIQEVVPRKDMRSAVARYLEFYARTRRPRGRKKIERVYFRRIKPDLAPTTASADE
jgi:acetyl-CoA carboxylase carboxyl transferase beta subunit